MKQDKPIPRLLRRTRTLKSGREWVGYYYNGRDAYGNRKEIPLGTDLNEAKRKWAELECQAIPTGSGLMRFIFDRFEKEGLIGLRPASQRSYLQALRFLRLVFNDMNIEAITPQHVAQYRDRRSRKAPIRANREISLLSKIFNQAREWGYTAKENPVRGVKKNKELPRRFYADDEVWAAVYRKASPELRDAMDLNYLTGQRPDDVFKMRFSDVRNDAIEVIQNKTGKHLRILLRNEDGTATELSLLIDRIRQRQRTVMSIYLVATDNGLPLSKSMRRARFESAREAAAQEADNTDNPALAERIRAFWFNDIRPKSASETSLSHASALLGHTEQEITERVYRRRGQIVRPIR